MQIDRMRLLGALLFVLGVLAGLVFNASAVWADLEASQFDPALKADESIDRISCPLIITPGETGVVRVSVKNTADRPVTTAIRAHISEGFVTLMRQQDSRHTIQPGETVRLSYDVTAEDAAWHQFVLVRVFVFPALPMHSRAGSCGVLAANLPGLPGWAVLAVWLAVSIAGMGGGIWLWARPHTRLIGNPLRSLRAMLILAGAIVAGMVFNLLGVWLPAGLLFLATVVLVTAMLAYFLTIA